MTEVKAPRAYSSALRSKQAKATRRLVLSAAHDLFVAQGYAATTIDQVAERAGVSRPTVFRAVGNKPTLLRKVRDVAIAGDDEPVPVAKRPATDAIREEPDVGRAIDLLARRLTAVASRYGAIYEVLRAAAAGGERDLHSLWETEERERLIGARFWIETLLAKGATLRPGLDVGTAVDVLWLLMAPDHFERLAGGRGWTKQRYQRWLGTSIAELFTSQRPGLKTD